MWALLVNRRTRDGGTRHLQCFVDLPNRGAPARPEQVDDLQFQHRKSWPYLAAASIVERHTTDDGRLVSVHESRECHFDESS